MREPSPLYTPSAEHFDVLIGELTTIPDPDRNAHLPWDTTRPVMVAYSAGTAQTAAHWLQALALQLLLCGPAHSHLALYEPRPSPQFGHLKRLYAQTERKVGQQLMGADAIHHSIVRLTDLAHQRFALLASAQVEDWSQYNALAKRPEALELLLIAELSADIGRDGDLALLHTLCLQGPRVGIIPLLLRGEGEALEAQQAYQRQPLKQFWSDVAPAATGLDWRHTPPAEVNQAQVFWRSYRYFGIHVGVTDTQCDAWVASLAARVTQTQLEKERPDFLSIPMGEEGITPANFALGETSKAYHAVVGGTTDGGRSTMLYNVLIQAMETHSPAHLQLTVIDFSGTGFPGFEAVAHVRLMCRHKTVTVELLAALDSFSSAIDQRAALMLAAGHDNIAEYNEDAAKRGIAPLTRHLVVIDEAHNMVGTRQTNEFVARYAKEGRKFGVHLVLVSASLQGVWYDPGAKGQFPLRIGFNFGDPFGSTNLFENNNTAAANLPKGVAIYNGNFGHPSANRTIHLTKIEKPEIRERLDALRARYPVTAAPSAEASPPAATPTASPAAWDHGANSFANLF